MSIIRVLLVAFAIAACTFLFGWISVPVIGAVYAIVRRDFSAPAEVALAALLGWSALLARVAMVPAFSVLLNRLGKILPIPGPVIGLVTLIFAAALAWSAARVVTIVVGRERLSGSGSSKSV